MREVVQDAIRFRGTTLEDEAYVDLFGKPGEFQTELKVYGRKGLAVPPVPHPDRDGQDLRAEQLLLPAVPELSARLLLPP